MIDTAVISGAVTLARQYLEDNARNSMGPIQFHLGGYRKDASSFDQVLKAECVYSPPWGWPVLDSEISTNCLSAAIDNLSSDSQFKTLVLTAQQPGQMATVVCDLLEYSPKLTIPHDEESHVNISNIDTVMYDICDNNLAPGECVSIVSLDMSYSPDYDLSAHMMYAQDGTDTILWVGTCAGNGRDPKDVLDAARRECAYTGRYEMLLAVSGQIIDIGDGRARIKNPHRLAVLDLI